MTSKNRVQRVVTFGTFDVFHLGHLRLLQRAADLGDELVVGISTDALSVRKKGRAPVYSQDERAQIIGALKVVEKTFFEESLEQKREYLIAHHATTLVMGDDWKGRFDEFSDICAVKYLPRTPAISTTETIERIRR